MQESNNVIQGGIFGKYFGNIKLFFFKNNKTHSFWIKNNYKLEYDYSNGLKV
jgi:hypothetical protein